MKSLDCLLVQLSLDIEVQSGCEALILLLDFILNLKLRLKVKVLGDKRILKTLTLPVGQLELRQVLPLLQPFENIEGVIGCLLVRLVRKLIHCRILHAWLLLFILALHLAWYNLAVFVLAVLDILLIALSLKDGVRLGDLLLQVEGQARCILHRAGLSHSNVVVLDLVLLVSLFLGDVLLLLDKE